MASKLRCNECGQDTAHDGVVGGGPCEHCGCKRPHGYVFFALLPFLLYFGACLAIEIFVPLPFPDEVKIPVYMGGLFLMWFCYANWSQRQD